MIHLHVSLLEGNPCLWAERDRWEEKPPLEPEEGIPSLPTDPGIKALSKILNPLLPDFKIRRSDTLSVLAWLPSRAGIPLPSGPGSDTVTSRRYKIRLEPYKISAIKLKTMDLAAFARLAEMEPPLEGGVVPGRSLVWMSRLFNHAINMVVTERFLPGLEYTGQRWEARWIPLPEPEDEQELQRLADSMPGAFRCLGKDEKEPPRSHPQQITTQAAAQILDALTRIAQGTGGSEERKTFPSIHDAWLHALASPDPHVKWDDEIALRQLREQLDQWQRSARITRESPFTFCMRLGEPRNGTGATGWNVDYLVQPKADPTLQLPVSELWNPSSGAFMELSRYGNNVSEYLLTILGQAARLCPFVNQSLGRKNPSGFELDGKETLDFLTRYADMLRRVGIDLMLPSWWTGQGPATRAGIRLKVKTPAMQDNSGLTLDSLFQFDYQFCFNGEPLSMEELEELARLKTPLVRLRGQWTYMTEGSIKTAIDFLRKTDEGAMTGRELLRISLDGENEMKGVPVEQVDVEEWLGGVLAKLRDPVKIRAIKTPKGFKGVLRPYQEKGLAWLSFLQKTGLGACLADDMGLGKTIQTLALIQQLKEQGERRPVFLVCPTSVVNNWKKEAEKFTPDLKVLVHHGADRKRKDAFRKAADRHALVLSSYGLLARDADFLKDVQWSGLVLDEAQNIKNHETRRARASRSIKADYRIALTGTPVENHVGDLWSIMDFLNPGLLGGHVAFKDRFYKPIQLWNNEQAASRLKRLTGPFILRRLKTDKTVISDLPEKIETTEHCTLTREQVTLYKAVLNEMEEKIHQSEGVQRKGMILAALTRLKQICNHPSQFSGDAEHTSQRSGKLVRLLEMLGQIRQSGEHSLVFTQYTEMGRILKNCLREEFMEDAFFLSGQTTRKKRDEMVRIFQEGINAPGVFILSLKAGGTGLNLSRANHVFHYDRWWNPAVENQATDRAFRIGQKKNVQVHKFLVAGSLEERIAQMIESKSELADKVIGKGEAGLTELSDKQIKELLKLGREAEGD